MSDTPVRAAMAHKSKVHSFDVPDQDNVDDLDSPAEVEEVGSLTIQESDNAAPENALWGRPPVCCLVGDGSTKLHFEILLARLRPNQAADDDLKVKRYVVYQIRLLQNTTTIDPHPSVIERRYTDFRQLYTRLRKDFPAEMANVPFPNKVLVGNFSTNLIAERSGSFEAMLGYLLGNSKLRESQAFLDFLQDEELSKACQYMDERRNEMAIPLLENCFRLLNKIFMDRSRPVLLILCRLVAAATTSPMPHHSAERWATLALNRYDTLCDIDLLPLYIPLLHTCAHLWWQKGLDQKPITDRLTDMSRRGIPTTHDLSLMQAIHKLDPRTETI